MNYSYAIKKGNVPNHLPNMHYMKKSITISNVIELCSYFSYTFPLLENMRIQASALNRRILLSALDQNKEEIEIEIFYWN